jgi:hypothetical protein
VFVVTSLFKRGSLYCLDTWDCTTQAGHKRVHVERKVVLFHYAVQANNHEHGANEDCPDLDASFEKVANTIL